MSVTSGQDGTSTARQALDGSGRQGRRTLEQIGLNTPLKELIGARTAARLTEKLELATVGDLLRYYPRKYDQRGKLTDLAKLGWGSGPPSGRRSSSVTEKISVAADRPGRGRRQGGRRQAHHQCRHRRQHTGS